jgi:hypothetical protein
MGMFSVRRRRREEGMHIMHNMIGKKWQSNVGVRHSHTVNIC